jgi:hypothetical protein
MIGIYYIYLAAGKKVGLLKSFFSVLAGCLNATIKKIVCVGFAVPGLGLAATPRHGACKELIAVGLQPHAISLHSKLHANTKLRYQTRVLTNAQSPLERHG